MRRRKRRREKTETEDYASEILVNDLRQRKKKGILASEYVHPRIGKMATTTSTTTINDKKR